MGVKIKPLLASISVGAAATTGTYFGANAIWRDEAEITSQNSQSFPQKSSSTSQEEIKEVLVEYMERKDYKESVCKKKVMTNSGEKEITELCNSWDWIDKRNNLLGELYLARSKDESKIKEVLKQWKLMGYGLSGRISNQQWTIRKGDKSYLCKTFNLFDERSLKTEVQCTNLNYQERSAGSMVTSLVGKLVGKVLHTK